MSKWNIIKVNYKEVNICNNVRNLKRVWNNFNASNHVLRNKCVMKMILINTNNNTIILNNNNNIKYNNII